MLGCSARRRPGSSAADSSGRSDSAWSRADCGGVTPGRCPCSSSCWAASISRSGCLGSRYARGLSGSGYAAVLLELRFDPPVGAREPLFEREVRLPAEDLAQARIVRVAAPNALRLRQI